ncbi:hypothetical protein WN48_09786 [Eufriesea mexicana]|uniref:Uncharacterized protein n=1 Tax=Eufriesea mexicana TaxID=516756 RepID=A0A310S9N1_9HYME|nr:hypothetical protein WN48_09786 [Eufriesea mexicana]
MIGEYPEVVARYCKRGISPVRCCVDKRKRRGTNMRMSQTSRSRFPFGNPFMLRCVPTHVSQGISFNGKPLLAAALLYICLGRWCTRDQIPNVHKRGRDKTVSIEQTFHFLNPNRIPSRNIKSNGDPVATVGNFHRYPLSSGGRKPFVGFLGRHRQGSRTTVTDGDVQSPSSGVWSGVQPKRLPTPEDEATERAHAL